MKIASLSLLAALALTTALAHGQSACEQLGVDCRHPQVDSRPVCDDACRRADQKAEAQAQQRRDEEWEEGRPAREAEAARKANEKAEERLDKLKRKAQKYANQAWALVNEDNDNKNCGKVIELYTKALALYDFRFWRTTRASCMQATRDYLRAYDEWEIVINDSGTPNDLIRKLRTLEWSNMYFRGYVCPFPPKFNGIEGCTRRKDHIHLDDIYVPLPYIQGRDWRPIEVLSSGPFSVITKDGHQYYGDQTNMTSINLMDARILTGRETAVRFILPDETAFTVGPESDVTFDNFVYNPNENYTEMTANIVKGIFRFVTEKIAPRSEPEITPSRKVHIATGDLFFRGTDVEIEYKPENGRLWIAAYDGEISFQAPYHTGEIRSYPIPVGKYLFVMGRGLWDTPTLEVQGADRIKPELGVTDKWDYEMTEQKASAPGRQ